MSAFLSASANNPACSIIGLVLDMTWCVWIEKREFCLMGKRLGFRQKRTNRGDVSDWSNGRLLSDWFVRGYSSSLTGKWQIYGFTDDSLCEATEANETVAKTDKEEVSSLTRCFRLCQSFKSRCVLRQSPAEEILSCHTCTRVCTI